MLIEARGITLRPPCILNANVDQVSSNTYSNIFANIETIVFEKTFINLARTHFSCILEFKVHPIDRNIN